MPMNIESIVLRNAQFIDINGMVDLLSELFQIEADFSFDAEKHAVALLLLLRDRRSAVFVACERHMVIGMITVQRLISTAEGGNVALIEDLVVKEDYRGNGIATRLLSEVFEWAEAESVTRVQLLADKNNEAALAFYSSNQWQTTNLICLRKKL